MQTPPTRKPTETSRWEFLAGATLLGAFGAACGSADSTPRLEARGEEIHLMSGNTLIGRIPAVAGPAPAAGGAEFTKTQDGLARTFRVGEWEVADRIHLVRPGLHEWQRSWTNTSGAPANADLWMELESAYAPGYTLIPGISYDANPEFGRRAPKGLTKEDGEPWIFSAFRSSVPAGCYSEGDGWSMFVFVSTDEESLDCGFSLAPRDGRVVHRLMWPARDNIPSRRMEPFQESMEVPAGESFTATAYFVVHPAPEPRRAWSAGLDQVWRTNRRDVEPTFPPDRLWDLGVQFAKETLWYDGDDFTGFSIGVVEEDGRWVQRDVVRYEIGWCGQNAAFGAALLQDYLKNKNTDSLEKGEKALDFWATNGRLDCGLFYTHYDAKLGLERWAVYNPNFLGRPAEPDERWVDTCNLGHGMFQYLVAAELAEQIGRPKPLWRQFALDACDFFVENHLPDGTFGKAWSLEGECLFEGVTTGAHICWPMLKAYRMTEDQRYLDTARRAFDVYYQRDLVERGFCAGGAIDADTIDKESGLPLLYSALDLYKITGDEEYLRAAEHAGAYMATWQWHYSVPYHPNSPLRQINYDHFAGTSITVMAQGQDPWGELIALGWLRLAEATGDAIWQDRAVQCFNQGTLGITDGTDEIKGLRRPPGSQNEGFFFAIRMPDGRRLWGDHNSWLVAWPSAHRLITLMHWPDWEVFV